MGKWTGLSAPHAGGGYLDQGPSGRTCSWEYHTPGIPAVRKIRQEDEALKSSQGQTARPSQNKRKQEERKEEIDGTGKMVDRGAT